MNTFNIPWKFLDLSSAPTKSSIDPPNKLTDSPKAHETDPPKNHKTFAQALTNLCDIPLSQFQQPVVKGDRLAIEIPEAAYEAGLEACKHNLHGRVIWPKGSTPLSVVALKAKLALIWKELSNWGIISLGKGYFEFTFSSLEDVRRVRSVPSWNLNPGFLKFFAWTKDFNPKMQHNTSAQVWVKIFGLAQEYWHKTILFTIAGSLGTPICIDSVTAKPMHERTFGQFARVLIDIDLMQPLRYKLLVERKGFAFFVDLEYEHIPAFCTECKIIGHNIETCKRWNMEAGLKSNKESNLRHKAPEKKQIYVQTTDGRLLQGKAKEVINVEREVVNVEANNTPLTHVNIEGNNTESPGVNLVGNNDEHSASKDHEIPAMHHGLTDNAILSPVSPREQLRLQDQQLEKDLNDGSDDSWSTDSQESFVNATQIGGDEVQLAADNNTTEQQYTEVVTPSNPIGGDINLPVAQNLIPDRVVRDMVFLKESWANMTETDDAALQNVEDTSNNGDSNEQGFQLHMSKNQKKAQKKLKQSSRDSYATRSKVPPKPFR
jgi:hypothetical protein